IDFDPRDIDRRLLIVQTWSCPSIREPSSYHAKCEGTNQKNLSKCRRGVKRLPHGIGNILILSFTLLTQIFGLVRRLAILRIRNIMLTNLDATKIASFGGVWWLSNRSRRVSIHDVPKGLPSLNSLSPRIERNSTRDELRSA